MPEPVKFAGHWLPAMLAVTILLVIAVLAVAARTGTAQGAEVEETANAPAAPARALHAVVIRQPEGAPRAITNQLDHQGNPATVACSTCHSTREPDVSSRSSEDLDEFHGGLVYAHGDRSCLSCHNPEDYDTLRLADGTTVEFTRVMDLCAQCHGIQARNYEHGAHGGMTGYWDLTRGGRTRNNCVDCHDPHSPQFVGMTPAPRSRDRFLTDSDSKHNNSKHHAEEENDDE